MAGEIHSSHRGCLPPESHEFDMPSMCTSTGQPRQKKMENILLTLLIPAIAAATISLFLRSRVSLARPRDDHLSSARQHREITRRYREEQASLTN